MNHRWGEAGQPSSARLVVGESDGGVRLDAWLSRQMDTSRSQVSATIDDGLVRINARPAKKADRVAPGDVIEVAAAPPSASSTPAAPVTIPVIFSDEHIVVIDKPPHVAVHPAPGWEGPTVTDSLAAAGIALSRLGPAERGGVVHRLDSGTSGVMVVAASDLAYQRLKDAFRDRAVDKTYRALVQGYPDPSSGTIDAPIGRHPHSSWKFAITTDGKPAITHYDTVEVFPGATLLEISLETGRTHQIRVHFQAERHPLVGDSLYGADPTLSKRLGLDRQWLHATGLAFDHPATGRRVEFASEPAPDLREALHRLEISV